MKKGLIIVIMLVLVLAIAAAVVVFVVLPGLNKPEHDGSYPTPKDILTTFYFPGEYFVTNISDSTKLFKIAVALAYDSTKDADKKAEQLSTYQPFIRDTIINLLWTKTEEQLLATDAQARLKQEIYDAVLANFKVDYITGVYVTDYVVQ